MQQIPDYGITDDCCSAALISRNGSIDEKEGVAYVLQLRMPNA
jgi:hypothetical protein